VEKREKMILIVEDEPTNRELAVKILAFSGYNTICAANGQEAVEIIKQVGLDLILLDLSLPIIDGWQVASIIRNNSLYQRLPIIAVTAHAMRGDKKSALAAGCTAYLSKPYYPHQLLEVINKYLVSTG